MCKYEVSYIIKCVTFSFVRFAHRPSYSWNSLGNCSRFRFYEIFSKFREPLAKLQACLPAGRSRFSPAHRN